MAAINTTGHTKARFINKILALATALITLSVGALGVWLYVLTAQTLDREIQQEVGNVGTAAADGIQKWLDGRALLLHGLADDLAVAPDAELKPLVSRSLLKKTFSESYFGAEADGVFTTFNPEPLPEGYDPRKRPWYQAAVAAKGLTLTEPYQDATTRKLVISAAMPVMADGKLRGVAGSDLPLDTLQTFLRSIDLGGKGYVFLVDGTGKVLVHPDESKVMKSSGFTPAGAATMSDDRGGDIVHLYRIDGLPSVTWYVGVALDRGKVTAPLRALATALTITVIGTIVIVIPLLGWVIVRTVARPITRMTQAMTALSAGNLAVDVPGLARRDEIGAMAHALSVFKDTLAHNHAMEAEVQRARERSEEEKRAALRRMADAFESSVKIIVSDVTSAAAAMNRNSQELSAIADDGRSRVATVATAAAETSGNVQTVAASAGEMTASVADISRQVNLSNDVARRAVERSEESSRTIKLLTEQAKNIGTVVELINSIASQTNLLALNATIEAARAGEAGRGFAVVASEVKNLAMQTARATEDISAQIGSMQEAAAGAETSIGDIVAVISQINEFTTTIAAAVEEQDASSREIARNVQQAAEGTQEISDNISGVQRIVEETGTSARQVLDGADKLAQDADRLSAEVDRFIREVRVG